MPADACRLTGEIMTASYPETALVALPATGRVVRGRVVARHEMGQVTVEWAGMRITGFPVGPAGAEGSGRNTPE